MVLSLPSVPLSFFTPIRIRISRNPVDLGISREGQQLHSSPQLYPSFTPALPQSAARGAGLGHDTWLHLQVLFWGRCEQCEHTWMRWERLLCCKQLCGCAQPWSNVWRVVQHCQLCVWKASDLSLAKAFNKAIYSPGGTTQSMVLWLGRGKGGSSSKSRGDKMTPRACILIS